MDSKPTYTVFCEDKEIGNTINISFPKINSKSLKCAFEQLSGAVNSLSIKLESSKIKYWIGFDGSAEYYKELEQRKNRQLLPGTYIGEIK